MSFAVLLPVHAVEEPTTAGERFNIAYQTLIKADEFRDKADWSKAAALYQDALQTYQSLGRKYPDWQPGVVRFRISYCTNQIAAIVRRFEEGQQAPALSSAAAEVAAATEPLLNSDDIASTGRSLLLKGDPENARVALLQALQRDPDNERVRTLLAVAQCQAGKYDDAALIAEQLVVDSPSNSMAHVMLSTARMGLGQIAEAKAAIRRAIELDPRSAAAHFNLAQILMMQDPPDVASAGKAYQAALQLGATPDPAMEKKLEH